MSPRPYRSPQRLLATEQTRARVLDAARELLLAEDASSFSVDAVARQAGVARMTVYYQFGSRGGLLEALFDHLAGPTLMADLPQAFHAETPRAMLSAVLRAFVRFWASDTVPIRRLRAMAALDAELGEVLAARDLRRLGIGRQIAAR